MGAETGDGRPRRLHPASLLFSIGAHFRRLVVPALLFAFFARGTGMEPFALVMLVPSALIEIVRYFSFSYRLGRDEIVIVSDLISRNERHIPFARIQNIDLVQSLAHRLLGVAEVRLETASGSKPEADLKVLSLKAVERMRERVFAERSAAGAGAIVTPGIPAMVTDRPGAVGESVAIAPPAGEEGRPPAGQVVLDLPVPEIVRLGVISNRASGLLLVGAGLIWEYGLADRVGGLDRLLSGLESLPVLQKTIFIAAVAVLAVLVLLMLSVIWTLMRLYGFRVERRGEDIRFRCGLFTRLSATVPRRRIQFLSVRETPLHRLWRKASVLAETASGAREEDRAIGQKWFLPLVPAARLREILRALGLGFLEEEPVWQPLSPGAPRRMLARRLLLATIAGGACGLLWMPWGFVALLLLIPLAVWHAMASARFTAWAMTGTGVLFRSGVWTRRVSATLFDRIQVVSLGRTPLDRRLGMASLHIDTAGSGAAGHRIRIPYLDDPVAERLLGELSQAAEAAPWRR